MTTPTPATPVPFTVVKGHPDEVETEAIARALAVLVAESTSSGTGADPREINRLRARTTSRGTWGTPTERLRGARNFNPTGFRA